VSSRIITLRRGFRTRWGTCWKDNDNSTKLRNWSCLALRMAEKKFGPESAELAMTCTNLADVLWNKKDLPGAGELYRRAVTVDSSLYGPENRRRPRPSQIWKCFGSDGGETAAARIR